MSPENVLAALRRREKPASRTRWLRGVGEGEPAEGEGAVAGVDTPHDE
jgi:hypothetical protein